VRRLLCLTAGSAALCFYGAFAQTHSALSIPAADSMIPFGPSSGTLRPAGSATVLSGQVQVAIKLQDPPLVEAVGAGAKQTGISMTADQQRAYVAQLNQKQDALMSQVRALGGTELGRVSKAHNALMVSIDAGQLANLRNIAGVTAVRPLLDSTTTAAPLPDLAATTAYVGALSLQNSGIKGQGVRVAMLDTGIDYTHYNLGGSGKVADYTAAAAVASGTPPHSLFPTAKVIGGYDFVGDTWPNSPLAPDPNPIDLNGHGSHTSDIVGGHSLDGLHYGMAPGSQLYAVKVCSSVSSACSGVAILEGIDFALDPNNTGTLNNAVDVISMSIGGPFGMVQDDQSEAFTAVVNFGVVSVISAGNDGNIPYILGGPASTTEVIAAGATTSVVSFGIPLVVNSPSSIAGKYSNTQTLDFAPVTTDVTGNIAYIGRGCPAGSISTGSPADAYLANPSGKIALIDRGACSVSLKIDAAVSAGAIGVLIGLVAPGDAIPFSNGGGANFAPTLVITQSTSNIIKGALANSAVNATISPANAIALTDNVASYTSRGPNYSFNMLKPDMSAPGTITAAEPGTGNGETTESGTSFACPMTAGAAALLLSKNHSLTPLDVKALLMETTEPLVYQNGLTQPGALAPLTRVGSGELRAGNAGGASTAAWDSSNPLAVSLSFGTYRLGQKQQFHKTVAVHNYSNTARYYQIANTYRDSPNQTGVTISTPSRVYVAPRQTASFNLTASVDPGSLPAWTMNGGSNGGNGALFNSVEYAGYLTLTSGSESIHLPWHILPHKAAGVTPLTEEIHVSNSPKSITLSNNRGAANGAVSIFSLTGTGHRFPASVFPGPGADFTITNLKEAGIRLVCIANCATNTPSFGVQFAITTFEPRSHPDVPAEFDVLIDVNNDGQPDLDVFNGDLGYGSTGVFSGQNAVWVVDLTASSPTATAYYYTIADLDSANVIFTAPLAALQTKSGLQLNYNTPFTYWVDAFDNYFTGNLTDQIGPMRYELDMPQAYSDYSDLVVPAGGTASIQAIPNNSANVYLTGPYNGKSPSQSGFLFMYADGPTGSESDTVKLDN
jgi:subtilisin family serine protease